MGEEDLVRLFRSRELLASGHVRQVREAHGLSLRACAEAVGGVSHVALLRWERGETVPRQRTGAAMRYVEFIERLAAGDAA